MEKRYQVFVSSTFKDLQDERQEIMQALLELDCIPSGMELFPAANEDQWSLIKKVIDDSDYYIIVLGGRYGSIGPDGLGYTEMEYRYAKEIGKPIIGFVHKSPGLLIADKCETTEEGKAKLEEFKVLVQSKPCRFWESPAELGSQVSRSLVKLIKTNPAIGWARADLVPDASAAEEILKMRREIEDLKGELKASVQRGPEESAHLAQGEDSFEINYTFSASDEKTGRNSGAFKSTVGIAWDNIFSAVSPLMMDEANEATILNALNAMLRDYCLENYGEEDQFKGQTIARVKITSDDFQTIKIQLRALGLITKSNRARSVKDTESYWTLTPYGDTVMTRLRAQKKKIAS